ncbi:MAG: hypothetical protein FWC56_03220, partial [Phycisphaerae bacterium]|nr:hypothetical protein [Phycisphaerae bacterium]
DRSIRAMATLKADADFVLSLAAMLHSTMPHPHAFKEARRVGHCLRCSNDEISDLTWLVRHIDSIEHVETLRLPEFKRLLAHERFDNLLELHRVACVADARPLTANVAAQQRREAIPPEQVAPPPWVTGEDLIAMGLTPGPMFGKVLNQLYDEQLNNQLTSRDSALERVRAIIATRP